MVSIIIRTKNEERWIRACLSGVSSQEYKDFEVIIVDNESTDRTLEKAGQFDIRKIVNCREYLPGKALNLGIKEAKGEFLVFLSGHCIPVNNKWLQHLVSAFSSPEIAGVYGRQEPMSFSPNSDKRDLALVFGLDRKIQLKDSFFHNANSIIRKEIWQKIPFDETATNIEDRIWAQEAQRARYKIVYEPHARVYHYHGIHQNGNAERCTNVVRILEGLHEDSKDRHIDMEKLNITAFIPLRGPVRSLEGKPILYYTIRRALESKYIKRTIVSTDDDKLAALAKELGAEAPFIRDPEFSQPHIDLTKVFRHTLDKAEGLNIFPDIVVCLEATFPFRPPDLIDNMIQELARKGLDSVIAARPENRAVWKARESGIVQLDEGLTPRQFKDPTFIELRGVCCVTHPEFIREGSLLGKKIGMYELDNAYSHLEVRSKEDVEMASHLIKDWFK